MGPGIAEALEHARKDAVRWANLYLLNAYANHEKERLAVAVFRARLAPHYSSEEIERRLAEIQAEAQARGLLPPAANTPWASSRP